MTAKKTRKARGPDNNKRLAELEAKEAARNPPPPTGPRHDYPRMYEAGRRARTSGIAKDQAPVFWNDAEREAWLEGYGT